MKFTFRIDDLELRSCNKNLLEEGEHTTAEIVKWFKEDTCYVVAHWVLGRECYDLMFVSDRFIKVDKSVLMELAEMGQNILNKEFDKL